MRALNLFESDDKKAALAAYWNPIIANSSFTPYWKEIDQNAPYKDLYSRCLRKVIEADPTQDKEYTNWMMTQVLKRPDFPGLFDSHTVPLVDLFHKLKIDGRLPSQYLNINQFSTEDKLQNILEYYFPAPKKLSKAEQIILDNGIYYEDSSHPVYNIIQVSNEAASVVLSDGTVWGDAWSNEGYFEENEKMPIFIINKHNPADKFLVYYHHDIDYNDNDKAQEFWTPELYNKKHQRVDLDNFIEKNQLIKQAMTFDLYQKPTSAGLNSLSKEDQLVVLKQKPEFLKFFNQIDEDLCQAALNRSKKPFYSADLQKKLSTKVKLFLIDLDHDFIRIFLNSYENKNQDIIPMAAHIDPKTTVEQLNYLPHDLITAFKANLCAAQYAKNLRDEALDYVVQQLGDVPNQLNVLSKCPELVQFINNPDTRIVDFIMKYHKPQIHLLQHVPVDQLRGNKDLIHHMTAGLLKKHDTI